MWSFQKMQKKFLPKSPLDGGKYLSKLGIRDFFNFLKSIFENTIATVMTDDIEGTFPPSLEANEGYPQWPLVVSFELEALVSASHWERSKTHKSWKEKVNLSLFLNHMPFTEKNPKESPKTLLDLSASLQDTWSTF